MAARSSPVAIRPSCIGVHGYASSIFSTDVPQHLANSGRTCRFFRSEKGFEASVDEARDSLQLEAKSESCGCLKIMVTSISIPLRAAALVSLMALSDSPPWLKNESDGRMAPSSTLSTSLQRSFSISNFALVPLLYATSYPFARC